MKSQTHNKRKKNGKQKGKLTNRTRKISGGRKRVENIVIEFERQYTSPDIKSKYRLIKGPSAYKGKGRLGYLINFLRTTANDFEEELAQTIIGVPPAEKNSQRYELIFKDTDNAMEPGAEKALPIHKSGDANKKK
jgi:hypothetical protein